jgi:hypothetical protein
MRVKVRVKLPTRIQTGFRMRIRMRIRMRTGIRVEFANFETVTHCHQFPPLFVEPVMASGAKSDGVGEIGRSVVGPKLDVMSMAEGRGSGAANAPTIPFCDGDALRFGE